MPALAALIVIALWLIVPYYLYQEEALNISWLVRDYRWSATHNFVVLIMMSLIVLLAIPGLPKLLRKKKQK